MAQHEHTLEEVIVTARPAGFQSMDHIAQPVTILRGEELTEKISATLGETLSQELGVSAGDFGQGASRPVIRGLAGPRVRILQNGLGTMDISMISADHAVTVEPMNAEQIEILRGPSTLLFGSGASGGLVNVSNNRIHQELPAAASVLVNASYNTAASVRSLGLSADAAIHSISVHVDALRRDSGNYYSASGEIRNSGLQNQDLNAGLSVIDNTKGFLGAAYGRYQSVYKIPAPPGALDEQVYIDQAQDRVEIAGRMNEPYAEIESIRLALGNVDYGHMEFEGPGQLGTVFSNDEWEGRLELQHKTIHGWDGTVGIHYHSRNFSAIGDEAFVPGTALRSVGYFVLEDRDWRDWHFETGLRLEHQTAEPDPFSGLGDVSHFVYSLSAGIVWSFRMDQSLGLAVTRAQRAPSIEELFSNGPHLSTGTYELGQPRLRPETANNLDLSLHGEQTGLHWTVNLFVNVIQDYIRQRELDNDGNGVADMVDAGRNPGGELLLVHNAQDDAVFYGMEAELRKTLKDTAVYRVDMRVWCDWVRARLLDGGNLPRIAPARIGGSIEYNRGLLHGDVSLFNVFTQGHVGRFESQTDGYVMLNAGLSYHLQAADRNMSISIRGTNLLDNDARRHTSFLKDRAPLPGRAAAVALRIEL